MLQGNPPDHILRSLQITIGDNLYDVATDQPPITRPSLNTPTLPQVKASVHFHLMASLPIAWEE
jgi:hypothetical protein